MLIPTSPQAESIEAGCVACPKGQRDWPPAQRPLANRRDAYHIGRNAQNSLVENEQNQRRRAATWLATAHARGRRNVDPSAKHANSSSVLAKIQEAPPGFEPGMADLQSAALATWLRRHQLRENYAIPPVRSRAPTRRTSPPGASGAPDAGGCLLAGLPPYRPEQSVPFVPSGNTGRNTGNLG